MRKGQTVVLSWVAKFLLLLGLLAALVVAVKALQLSIDYDEAYNLQIVDNLAKGNGYASYGAFRGTGAWLFDPHITTGPAVLVPLAGVWHLTEGSVLAVRLFMLSFLAMYLAGIYALFRQRAPSLLIPALAVAAPLCLVWLTAGMVLGELAATAMLVWAAWAVSKNRPLVAGLLVGLAVQTKLVYGLAGATLLAAWLIATLGAEDEVQLKPALGAAFLAALPSLVFEYYRLYSFGNLRDYKTSFLELLHFLGGQNINHRGTWLTVDAVGAKLVGLYQLLPPLSWICLGLMVGLFFVAAVLRLLGVSRPVSLESTLGAVSLANTLNQRKQPFFVMVLLGLGMGGFLMLLGWITQSRQLTARQALPFWLLSLPVWFALGGYAYFALREQVTQRRNQRIIDGIFLGILLLFAVSLVTKSRELWRQRYFEGMRQEREKVIALIKQSGAQSLFVDGWYQNPEYQLLAGIPAMPARTDAPQLLMIQDYQQRASNMPWEEYKKRCAQEIYASPQTLLCWLPKP